MGKCVLLCNVINENAMKKAIISLFAFLLYIGIGDAVAQGTFLLRGKATNLPADKRQFELAVTHPYKNESHIVRVCPDGTFEQTISLTGKLQDVYLYLGDAVTVFTFPGDTINLEFDYKNLPESVRVWGNTPERSRELELCMEIDRKHKKQIRTVKSARYLCWNGQMTTDSLRKQAITLAKAMQQTISEFKGAKGDIMHEDYFWQKSYFSPLSVLNEYYVLLREASEEVQLHLGKKEIPPYLNADFDFFSQPDALDFMRSYLFESFAAVMERFHWGNADEYNIVRGKMMDLCIKNKHLRDWFQVYQNFFDLRFASMNTALKYAEWLMPTLDDADAKAFLQHQLDNYVHPFIPGAPAREMVLPDFDGKDVALSSLRGKYVYMDIWAENCGPCRAEFQKAQAFHDKYAAYGDKLVCLFVCVDGNKEACRKIIDKYNLWDKGIHLFADEAHQEEAMKYDQRLWPTYVLISPDGKIVEYNTARPSELLGDGENILDRCLKK